MRKTKISFADAGSASTILKMALERVDGFAALYRRFERKMTIAGRSSSTITNYGRHIAAIDLHRGMLHIVQGKGRKDRYVPLGTCSAVVSHLI